MSYATPQDLINRYPQRDLEQITDEAGQQMNVTAMQVALNDASVEIDCYLESRFKLPLTVPTIPAALMRMCCDIAIYRLLTLRPIHDGDDARKRYEDAIEVLTKVSKGNLTLGLSPTAVEPPPATPLVQLETSSTRYGSLFTRHRLRAL